MTTESTAQLKAPQELLGHRFKDPQLLRNALSHSSTRAEGGAGNERLEFLGDAVLGMVVSDLLYRKHPDHMEGELTRARSALVSRRTLARLARRHKLHHHVQLGRGMVERKSLPVSVLANVAEAVIAAVYLDSGITAARRFIRRFLKEEIQAVSTRGHPPNYKSLLQQFTQRRWSSAPSYRVVRQTGPHHERMFRVVAVVKGRDHGSGSGNSKKEAEQRAAKATLAQLQRRQREASTDDMQ